MKQQNNRSRIVGLRLTHSEYDKVQQSFEHTTCKKLSDYIRQVLLNKPTVVTYRNTSVDDFMAEMVLLRKELNAMGNNLNQVVRKLNMLSSSEAMVLLLSAYESQRLTLKNQVEKINAVVEKVALLW